MKLRKMKQVTKDILKRVGYTALYGGLAAASLYFWGDQEPAAIYDPRTGGYFDRHPADLPVLIGSMGALYNSIVAPIMDFRRRNLKKSNLENRVSNPTDLVI